MPFNQQAADAVAARQAELHTQIADLDQAIDVTQLDKTGVLITGGASGLGRRLALACASHGAYVTIADVSEVTGSEVAKEAARLNLKLQFIQCDVTSWKSQVNAFRQALQFHNSLDHVIASAGIAGTIVDLNAYSLVDADPPMPTLGAIEVGLKGSYYTVQLAIHCMAQREEVKDLGRSIVMISSQAGYQGMVTRPDYCGAKFGIRGILKALRPSLPQVAIRINMLAPTYIRTPMTEVGVEIINSRGYTWGRIEEVEKAVLMMLCSNSMHGRSILVDQDGLRDMRDDPEGLDGGLAMADHLNAGLSPLFCA